MSEQPTREGDAAIPLERKALMAERHETSFGYFDLSVEVADTGDVTVEFAAVGQGVDRIRMDWNDLREVIDFVGKHALNMENPWLGEYDETVEGAQVAAEV